MIALTQPTKEVNIPYTNCVAWLERGIYNAEVAGSSPAIATICLSFKTLKKEVNAREEVQMRGNYADIMPTIINALYRQ